MELSLGSYGILVWKYVGQKQVSRVWINNYTMSHTMWCNELFMPVSCLVLGTKILMQIVVNWYIHEMRKMYLCWVWVGGGGVGVWPGPGFSVEFRIDMISPARWVETLQRAKNGGWNYIFCRFLAKNRAQNTFSSFLLKYRGRNYTNFPETWKSGVEMTEHM